MNFNKEKMIEHLSGMVSFPTVSNADSNKMNFEVFYGLHKYLENTYPLIHEKLNKQIVGKAGLLYHWQGKNQKGLEPILLAAHQDVVPEGDWSKWIIPPYQPKVIDGLLYGRGANDCKGVMLAVLESVEELLKDGYQPDCDIYLAFGYNEEVMGGDYNSALAICDVLKEKGVHLGCVIDEGGGVHIDQADGLSIPVAYIRTGEKGYADYQITLRGNGGHSMNPPRENIIVEMGKIAQRIQENPFPLRVIEAVHNEYKQKFAYMEKQEVYSDLENHLDELEKLLEDKTSIAPKFRTTMAITMINAGTQANVLPVEVNMVVNVRLLHGDTIESVRERLQQLCGEKAEIKVLKGINPSKISLTDSYAYQCIKDLTLEMNPDAIVIPAIVCGGTDAHNYESICDSVYRFGGYRKKAGAKSNAHNFNENFVVENCEKGPEFFYRFIKKYNQD